MQKVVIITGAGSGIGRATARVLLDAGHRVVLVGRRSEPLVSVADGNPNARVVPTDVTDSASVQALFVDVVAAFGRVDVLFNNAGVFGPSASILDIDDQQWHSTWRTNVDGAVFCAREAARASWPPSHPGAGGSSTTDRSPRTGLAPTAWPTPSPNTR